MITSKQSDSVKFLENKPLKCLKEVRETGHVDDCMLGWNINDAYIPPQKLVMSVEYLQGYMLHIKSKIVCFAGFVTSSLRSVAVFLSIFVYPG